MTNTRFASEPHTDEIDGLQEGRLSRELFENVKERAEEAGYGVTGVLCRRAVLPIFDKPVLFQQGVHKRDIDVPIKLMADDEERLRGYDAIFTLEDLEDLKGKPDYEVMEEV